MAEETSNRVSTEGNDRALYRSKFAPMPEDARGEAAKTAEGADLRALCHDPLPRVIYAAMRSSGFSTVHARIVARFHKNAVGLGHIAAAPRYARDPEVRRLLFKNGASGQLVIKKLLGERPLPQLYQLVVTHDMPEATRTAARNHLKNSWARRNPNEKAELIIKTDGRCCALLVGESLDGKAAGILGARSVMSAMMIRNLARWPGTPPSLLQNMFHQPAVNRDKSLEQILLRHPNLPAVLKRGPR